jgi:threonine dehydratase
MGLPPRKRATASIEIRSSICQDLLTDPQFRPPEREMLDAMRLLLLDEHIVAEAAGAAATAAFLLDEASYTGRKVALLVTGANVSPDVLRRAVN